MSAESRPLRCGRAIPAQVYAGAFRHGNSPAHATQRRMPLSWAVTQCCNAGGRRMIRQTGVNRRSLLMAVGASALAIAVPAWARRTMEAVKQMQDNWRDYLTADVDPPAPDDTVELDTSAWRERLSGAAFDVLRDEGTERPFSSALND